MGSRPTMDKVAAEIFVCNNLEYKLTGHTLCPWQTRRYFEFLVISVSRTVRSLDQNGIETVLSYK